MAAACRSCSSGAATTSAWPGNNEAKCTRYRHHLFCLASKAACDLILMCYTWRLPGLKAACHSAMPAAATIRADGPPLPFPLLSLPISPAPLQSCNALPGAVSPVPMPAEIPPPAAAGERIQISNKWASPHYSAKKPRSPLYDLSSHGIAWLQGCWPLHCLPNRPLLHGVPLHGIMAFHDGSSGGGKNAPRGVLHGH